MKLKDRWRGYPKSAHAIFLPNKLNCTKRIILVALALIVLIAPTKAEEGWSKLCSASPPSREGAAQQRERSVAYKAYKPYKPYTNTGIKKDTRELRERRLWVVGGVGKTLAGIKKDTRERGRVPLSVVIGARHLCTLSPSLERAFVDNVVYLSVLQGNRQFNFALANDHHTFGIVKTLRFSIGICIETLRGDIIVY